MDTIGARIARDYPDSNKGWGVNIELFADTVVGTELRQSLLVLLSAVGMILLIGPGAKEFLDELRSLVQVVILSDTFEQFATPLLRQLNWPALLCHKLVVENDRILNYQIGRAHV